MLSMTLPDETPIAPSEQPPTGEPAPRGPLRRPFSAAVLVAALAALGGAAVAHFAWPPASTTSADAPLFGLFPGGTNRAGVSTGTTAATASVASQIDPGLVDIDTITGSGAAAGTGMVVTANGEVITNNHVISGATQISAYDVGNGHTYSAHVVGYDRAADVAVIQLQAASGLSTVPLGDSSTVRVGASVVTVGNAGGIGGTPSAASGTVAALHRSITAGDNYVAGDVERLNGVIQISGQLEPGDSGGPLVIGGKVVGMDTAASSNFSFQSSNAGEGFAIPINEVLAISRQIVAGQGSSTIHIGQSALIGVYVSNTNKCIGDNGVVLGSGSGVPGALVCPVSGDTAGVVPGSPASATSLTGFDTITALAGKPVTSARSLLALMDTHHPGERVLLTWVDKSGHSHSATVRLAAGPAD